MATINGDSDQLPLRELEDRLCTLAGQIAAATAEFLRLLADFEAREGWSGPGIISCAHWLSWRCGMSHGTAREHVRVARALRSLPATADTFAAGRLSFSKVRAITRVATPDTEHELVDLGLSSTAGQLERIVRALPAAVPDLVPTAAPRAEPRPPRLGWEWCEDGTLRVSGRLSPEDGAALLAMLRATAETRTADGAAQPTSVQPETATADPAVSASVSTREGEAGSFSSPVVGDACNVALERLRTEQDPSKAPAEVVVHVDADLLTGLRAEAHRGTGSCQVDGGPALTLSVVERLACDGGVRLTTHGSDGRTLDMGRRRRRPTPKQFRALRRRDGGCAMPGCSRTRFLHAHHVRFWSRGGHTTMDNLVLLCGEHHRALHDGAFSIVALGRQRFRFVSASGTTIEWAPAMQGSGHVIAAAYPNVTPESLTPSWDGEPMSPECVDSVITRYAWVRHAEQTGDHPWATAA